MPRTPALNSRKVEISPRSPMRQTAKVTMSRYAGPRTRAAKGSSYRGFLDYGFEPWVPGADSRVRTYDVASHRSVRFGPALVKMRSHLPRAPSVVEWTE